MNWYSICSCTAAHASHPANIVPPAPISPLAKSSCFVSRQVTDLRKNPAAAHTIIITAGDRTSTAAATLDSLHAKAGTTRSRIGDAA
jgi:hypothetical protein